VSYFDWAHGSLGGMIVAGFVILWRKINKLHKVVVAWNGHKVTVENETRANESDRPAGD
jgi:hypothetical protein